MTLTDEDRALTYEEAEKLALQAIHDVDGRGMVGRGRNHLHQRVARAILSAARQARTQGPGQGWEPIETALRNGEEVLVWGKSIGRQIATAKDVARHEPHEWPGGWGFPTGATHWRPIPAPPASQIKEG